VSDRLNELVYDWNQTGSAPQASGRKAQVLDETLRDGLQSPSVQNPSLDQKLEALHLISSLGVGAANLGLPSVSERALRDCERMLSEIARAKLPITPVCAGRTLLSDVTPIVELAQRTGVEVEVSIFVGASKIRRLAEDWDAELIRDRSKQAIDLAVKAGLPVTFVTEDTTRSHPEALGDLFKLAIDRGANRLCLCDTVGHATPDGVRRLVSYALELIQSLGTRTELDWHGHNDRGLALANALAAFDAGATRIHATALGVGERVGNTAMELLLLNLKLLSAFDGDLSSLSRYCERMARYLGIEIPHNHPLVGPDAFRTATGVHAAAIVKALNKGQWLAESVYNVVPASTFGKEQQICIGHMSGASNVTHWLRARDIEPSEALVKAILARAKESDRVLSEEEVLSLVARAGDY
jgi:isopropylmalate/homocitrate/citramalate synthase